MAIDVHIIEVGKQWPKDGSYTSFGFGNEHEEIVNLAYKYVPTGSQIAKMRDYYDDVIYEGENLSGLISELHQVIQALQETDRLRVVLEEYQKLCIRAAHENKAILLFAD